MLMGLLRFFQVQKRSGAWFYKGRDQQGLPSPVPLSRPQQSSTEDNIAQGGHGQSQAPFLLLLYCFNLLSLEV